MPAQFTLPIRGEFGLAIINSHSRRIRNTLARNVITLLRLRSHPVGASQREVDFLGLLEGLPSSGLVVVETGTTTPALSRVDRSWRASSSRCSPPPSQTSAGARAVASGSESRLTLPTMG